MPDADTGPSDADVWEWLESVPDPEIPVVSIVDLGIVRDVNWIDGVLEIAITPTYSGCPATSVINLEISEAIRRRGIENFRISTQIAPPWTTDWISRSGREKLKAYGIAPPVKGVDCAGMLVNSGQIECPQCASRNTERVSQFGSTPCKAAFRCKDCLEPFDYFKSF